MADVLYFCEENPGTTTSHLDGVSHPEGYSYEFASAPALGALSVADGELVSPGGVRYRMLALDPRSRTLSLGMLERIRELVDAGATVAGCRPEASRDAGEEGEFHSIAETLWGSAGFIGERAAGKGRVISGIDVAHALAMRNITPSFSYANGAADSQIHFIHRSLRDGDLYLIRNRRAHVESVEASFRVAGKRPELWRAGTGSIEFLSFRIVGNRTVVPLQLGPCDTVFVVFRKPVARSRLQALAPGRDLLGIVNGPWQVIFSPGQGAPWKAQFEQLMSWTQSADLRIKYYSGTARYKRTLRVPKAWLTQRQRIELDLGAVRNLAEVLVNGKSLGVLWKAPFRVDITDSLQRGNNTLTVRVTNTWANWLIGTRRVRGTSHPSPASASHKEDSQLLDSGLLGPVSINAVKWTRSPGQLAAGCRPE